MHALLSCSRRIPNLRRFSNKTTKTAQQTCSACASARAASFTRRVSVRSEVRTYNSNFGCHFAEKCPRARYDDGLVAIGQ